MLRETVSLQHQDGYRGASGQPGQQRTEQGPAVRPSRCVEPGTEGVGERRQGQSLGRLLPTTCHPVLTATVHTRLCVHRQVSQPPWAVVPHFKMVCINARGLLYLLPVGGTKCPLPAIEGETCVALSFGGLSPWPADAKVGMAQWKGLLEEAARSTAARKQSREEPGTRTPSHSQPQWSVLCRPHLPTAHQPCTHPWMSPQVSTAPHDPATCPAHGILGSSDLSQTVT